jgi:catechol 2,3-dioxygenase-like lactoylglutathione lyase family enzyme
MDIRIEAIDHLVLNVEDVDRTAQWYERALGMRRETYTASQEATRVALAFGEQKINLRPVTTSQTAWFTARSAATGSADLCFLTESAPALVVEHLNALGIPIESGPVEKSGARGTLCSVYYRDPDGNLIEIASYAA